MPALLLAILLGGALIRLSPLWIWSAEPALFLHQGRPILAGMDGYAYLSLAQALDEGYEPIDARRGAPRGVARPRPPPLLSVLAWLGSRITGAPLVWTAALLAPLLGVLLALPVFALGRELGGSSLGLLAALASLAAPYYFARSRFGYFDTDVIVVTLSLTLSWLLLRFATRDGRQRWLALIGAVAAWLVFLWGWDQGRAPATLAFGLPLGAAVAVSAWRRPRERWLWLGLAAAGGLALLAAFGGALLDRAAGALGYLSAAHGSGFPPSAGMLAEQRGADLARLALGSAGSLWGLAVGAVGLALLLWRRPIPLLFLAFPAGVGLLSFFGARFMLFAAPLVALGLAAAVLETWRLRAGSSLAKAAAVALALGVGVPIALRVEANARREPARRAYQVEALAALRERTPSDAVIWTFWGHGYAVQFYGRRATLGDGGNRSDRLGYVLSAPLAMEDFRAAANWIGFFAAHGPLAGLDRARGPLGEDWHSVTTRLRRLLAAGPERAAAILHELGLPAGQQEELLAFLFPGPVRPVYVWLDFGHIRTGWPTDGTWDFRSQRGQRWAHEPLAGVQADPRRIAAPGLEIDVASGLGSHRGTALRLARLVTPAGRHDYGAEGLFFHLDPEAEFGMLLDPAAARSVGVRLFLGAGVEGRFFGEQPASPPFVRLWRVHSERFAGP